MFCIEANEQYKHISAYRHELTHPTQLDKNIEI